MTNSDTIELTARSPLPSSTATEREASQPEELAPTSPHEVRDESELAPIDGGWRAWTFLAAAFLIDILVYGFQDAFGVFLDAYLRDPTYASQKNARTLLPLIGPIGSGIMYCSGPLIFPAVARYPAYRRKFMWGGAILACASLFAASYTTNLGALIALQGIGYSVGGAVMYAPCLSYLAEWFVRRRGFANGIMFAGTSVGGLFLPLVLPGLIEKHGIPTTLRNLAIATACLLLPCIPFAQGRLPVARVHAPTVRAGRSTLSLLRHPSMLSAFMMTLVQSFAYFVPLVWLPTYGSTLFTPQKSASSLALLNGSAVFGRLILGYAADRIDPVLLGLFVLICSSISTFVFWGILGYTYAGLLVFAVAYGIFAGAFGSLLTGFLRPVAKDDPVLTTSLFGLLFFSRGVGNILSSPISSALSVDRGEVLGKVRSGFDVAGGKYERVIIYTGSCFAGAAVVALAGWWAQRLSR